MSNLAVISDKNDNVIGYKDRHSIQPGEYVRIAILWVENSQGQVLIAQRSPDKKLDPGKWGPAAAGTVEEGETYESNVYKEAEEEIGVTGVPFKELKKLSYLRPDGVGRHSMVYTVTLDRPAENFKLQTEEVAQVAWIDKPDLFADIKSNPDKYVPSSRFWEENFG